jgi:hypothetical protein
MNHVHTLAIFHDIHVLSREILVQVVFPLDQ